MKVGDLVRESPLNLSPAVMRFAAPRRTGIVLETTEIPLPDGGIDIMAMVLWNGDSDWSIIYPEDVTIISQGTVVREEKEEKNLTYPPNRL